MAGVTAPDLVDFVTNAFLERARLRLHKKYRARILDGADDASPIRHSDTLVEVSASYLVDRWHSLSYPNLGAEVFVHPEAQKLLAFSPAEEEVEDEQVLMVISLMLEDCGGTITVGPRVAVYASANADAQRYLQDLEVELNPEFCDQPGSQDAALATIDSMLSKLFTPTKP